MLSSSSSSSLVLFSRSSSPSSYPPLALVILFLTLPRTRSSSLYPLLLILSYSSSPSSFTRPLILFFMLPLLLHLFYESFPSLCPSRIHLVERAEGRFNQRCFSQDLDTDGPHSQTACVHEVAGWISKALHGVFCLLTPLQLVVN
ncbi:unnamed protein product [Schistocephalus solidus]|uniref:Uncharacterized protein n=1 Tax=Schistocephalus solidus TaxID=70667 RepID=A0A3P7D985_SCHSO|nr:unnamed protein product [Schistocephalus solidus]